MEKKWWHDAIVYQIYPKSFADSNGDGAGDLQGITGRLDYLAELGVNTIWLCPIFASPMVDNGYDISDYQAVNPDFGTLEDLEELLAQAKKRGIRILLDLVLNHTSDQHAWFRQAVVDRSSPYHDYYIFKEGKDGGPPNNWRSNFGGSAWTYVPETGDYYFHAFAPEQPDLNWENSAMRRELYHMIHWWMDKGVAGFRIDAISFIKKDPAYPDLPSDAPDGLAHPGSHWLVHPGIEAFLGEMRDQVFLPRDAYTVAEANAVTPSQLKDFIGENGFFSTIFDFSYTDIDLKNGSWYDQTNFTRRQLRDAMFASQKTVCEIGHGAPYLENHDQNRSPNKYLAPEEICNASKTMLGMLYFFLQGVPYIYQGQELGMVNHPWKSLEEFDDVAAPGQYQAALDAGLTPEQAFAAVAHRVRDNSRTPMLWDESEHAGFTTGKPWLPIHPDYPVLNAKVQQEDEDSVLSFYKSMTALRREYSDLFFHGKLIPQYEEQNNIFAYERSLKRTRILILCNFCGEEARLSLPAGRLLLGNLREAGIGLGGETTLAPFEAMAVLLEG